MKFPPFLRPVFKCHGGKRYLAKWIISHFPDNYQEMTYVEPYCGAASVLLNKFPSKKEIINDINSKIISIFRTIRDKPWDFIDALEQLEYNQTTFDLAKAGAFDPPVNEFVLRRMSRGGLREAFAWSDRLRGGKAGDVNAWETMLKVLPNISARIVQVSIFNDKALELIWCFNNQNTLFYCDPPYLQETRASKNVYEENEMTEEDHIYLCQALRNFKGKAIISGYDSELYRRELKDWNMKFKDIANNASQQKVKQMKKEFIWMNY